MNFTTAIVLLSSLSLATALPSPNKATDVARSVGTVHNDKIGCDAGCNGFR